jgi:poly [ADP-ribose] polymerase
VTTKFRVDKESGLNHYNVFKDYCSMLNLTDVSYGIHGHNKFYFMQLLQRDDSKKWTLFMKYGRVGAEKPQKRSFEFYNRTEARVAFEQRFFEKTHNNWEDKDYFQEKPGKYSLVKVENDGETLETSIEKEAQLRKLLIKSEGNSSELAPKMQNLMEMIWDFDRMSGSMREMNIDTAKFPLGRLSKEQIRKGYLILSNIQKNLLIGNGYVVLLIF